MTTVQYKQWKMVSVVFCSYMHSLLIIFYYIVPDGPPLNVILTSPTSTSISINWDLPDPLVRNGIITKHQLNYTEVTQPLNWTIVLLNGSTSYFIEGLKIFTQYYVSVRAGTQVTGFGLFSDPKIIRTCMLNFICTYSYVYTLLLKPKNRVF